MTIAKGLLILLHEILGLCQGLSMTNQHDNVVDDFWEAVLVHQGLNKPIVVRRERYPKGTMSEAIPTC